MVRELPNQLNGFRVPDDKLTPNGGAVAIGHPFGATGTRYILTLAIELREREARYGVAGYASALAKAWPSSWKTPSRPELVTPIAPQDMPNYPGTLAWADFCQEMSSRLRFSVSRLAR